MHIYSQFILKWDYLKARNLEVTEQNYLWIWIQHTQINKKTPIPILASDQKFIFVIQWYQTLLQLLRANTLVRGMNPFISHASNCR